MYVRILMYEYCKKKKRINCNYRRKCTDSFSFKLRNYHYGNMKIMTKEKKNNDRTISFVVFLLFHCKHTIFAK